MTAPAVNADVGINFKTKGVDAASAAVHKFTGEAENSLEKTGRATQRIATGVAEIAKSGEVAGRGLNEVLKSVSEIAFSFGPAGLFVGAVGIAGAAIYEALVEPIQKANEEAANFKKSLEELARAQNLANASQRQQTLYSGDAFARRGSIVGETEVQFIARSQGIEGLRRALAEEAKKSQAVYDISTGAEVGTTFTDRYVEINRLLEEMAPRYEEITALVDDLSTKEGERAKNAQATAKFVKDQADATKLAADQAKRWGESYNRVFNSGTAGVQTIQDFSKVATNADATKVLQDAMNAPFGKIKPPPVSTWLDSSTEAATKAIDELATNIQQAIGQTIGDAVSAGFDAAFSGRGIGGAISALSGTALKGLGALFKEVGEKSLIGLKFMQSIHDAIVNFNPVFGLAASLGLIALGSALQAAGSSAGGRGGGASYSGSSIGGSAAPAPIVVNPGGMPNLSGVSPKQSVVVNANIIGPNDPQAGRQLLELINNATRRVS